MWYFEKEKSYDIEVLSIGRVLNKEQDYQKQKGLETSDQSLFRFTKQVQENSLIINVLPDQVWWCIIMKLFLIYLKHSANLGKSTT